MKNILILLLTVGCGALAYLQFGMPIPAAEDATPPTLECPPVEVTEEEEPMIEPLSPTEFIQNVEINGISLSTPLDDVDGLLEEAGYDCDSNDSRVKANDEESRDVTWQCKHVSINSSFNITATDGLIQKIVRAGKGDEEDMDEASNKLAILKARLNDNSGIRVIQKGADLNFQIFEKSEGAGSAAARYMIRYMPQPDDKDPIPANADGLLNVNITR